MKKVFQKGNEGCLGKSKQLGEEKEEGKEMWGGVIFVKSWENEGDGYPEKWELLAMIP